MSDPRAELKQLQEQFAAHLRDPASVPPPEGIEDRRMAIYRDLFFNNIQGQVAGSFPVLRKLYDKRRWRELVRDFYVRHRAHTPLFPELPREFLQFVQDCRGPQQGDPPFIAELCHYEWVELAVAMDDREPGEASRPDGDLMAERPVVSPLAWRLSYQWPVHRIRVDFQPSNPPPEPTHLVVYRDHDDRVHFLEINAVTARLVDLLQANPMLTGRDAVGALAAEMGRPLEALLDHGGQMLQTLRAKGVVLGTEPAPSK